MTKASAPVGWHGIIVDAPTDWSLVGISGDAKKGYFRVDSPVASALEVKWESAGGKKPDLTVKAREFLSNIEKSVRKRKIKFTKDLKTEGEDTVRFLWRADRLGQGRMTYCPDCDRIMIGQLISTRDENVSRVGSEILDSMRDHRDDGWVEWALYELDFAVPPGYKIAKQTLMSGYIALTFKRGASTIVVERWGLANTLVGHDTIEEWYRKDAMPDVKGYRASFAPESTAGHEGLKVSGRRAGIQQAAKALAYSLTLHPHPGLLTGYVWHCEDSNRLFSVRVTHAEGETIAERIRDLIKCHQLPSLSRGGVGGEVPFPN